MKFSWEVLLIKRVFHALGGPGDIIQAHDNWKHGKHDRTEVSITFTSQIEDFCKDINAEAYFVSPHPRVETVRDGQFTFEHRPKPPRGGVRFHLTEIAYGVGLLATALRFGADVALLDSGATHFFVMTLFRICGIRVVPILHNTLWPSGFPPTGLGKRLVMKLDTPFWKRVPLATIGVSPECERQVDQLTKGHHPPIFQARAQFVPEYFAQIPPPPPHDQRPFQIMFIGRVNRIKGVFDILEIARRIEESHAGLIRWEICGRGPHFDELKSCCQELGLEQTFQLRGWTSLEDLIGVYARCHASIVPTRSDFSEGLAMTAAEAILAGRPLITNPVVPALELLRPACVAARTNDVDSHHQAVLKLATDAELYARLCRACPDLRVPFYDRRYGLAAALKRALASDLPAAADQPDTSPVNRIPEAAVTNIAPGQSDHS
ncbi:MAG TPA: glycosyltransferase family 4 protein [Isosphaeraceae bacterium]|nr:glycosyltransferase family 4 protein [Isosphaeraceae bacterium]